MRLWEQFIDLLYEQKYLREKNVYLYKKRWKGPVSKNFMFEKQTRIAVTKEPVDGLPEAYVIIKKIPRDSGYKTLDLSDELDKAMKDSLERLY